MNTVMLSVRLFQIVIANKCYECLTVSLEGGEGWRGWGGGRVGGTSGRGLGLPAPGDSHCFSGGSLGLACAGWGCLARQFCSPSEDRFKPRNVSAGSGPASELKIEKLTNILSLSLSLWSGPVLETLFWK